MNNTIITIIILTIFWGLIFSVEEVIKRRGGKLSKLAENKPIYNKIAWGIYMILGILAIWFLVLIFSRIGF